MSAKADFQTTDGRVFKVAEYRVRETWDWDAIFIVDYDLVQMCPHHTRDGLEWRSSTPYSFEVHIAEEEMEVTTEKAFINLARYAILVWLEHNCSSGQYRDHKYPILLNPFS